MFALLEHETTPADAPPGARQVHWDLIVEVPGQKRLPTWRLTQNPLAAAADVPAAQSADPSNQLQAGGAGIPAQRIQEHRPLYLDYEGEIRDGRGRVRRLDRGPAVVERLEHDRLVVVLDGRALRGRFEIAAAPDGQLWLQHIIEPQP